MGLSRWIDRMRTPSFPSHESVVPRNAQKQWRWKIIDTLLRRWGYDWNYFRTIISGNQLSIYGAVSDVCEEYGTCQTRTVRPVLARQSDPLVEPAKLFKNEWKGFHNKIEWSRFVLMQDSWQQLKSDSTSCQNILTSSYNVQNHWHVVSTLCHGTKNLLARKIGFDGTPKLDPCWKSQPVTCNVNMERKLELNL